MSVIENKSQTQTKNEIVEQRIAEAVETINTYRNNVKETGLVRGVLVEKIQNDFIVLTMLSQRTNHSDPRYQQVRHFSSDLIPAMQETGIPISRIYIGTVRWVRNEYFKLKSESDS